MTTSIKTVLTRRFIAGTLAGLALVFALAIPALAANGFPDVPGTSPYYGPITDLDSRGAINGYGNGDFGPDDPVTRQQFAKMIVKTLGLTVTGYEICPFTDVAKASAGASDPFYPDKYVAICYDQGWIGAKTATTFGPFDDLSRAELIAIAARTANLPTPPAAYSPPFGDISAEHYTWARKGAYAGLLAGLEGMGPDFDFFQNASRAECAQVLYNMVQRARSQNANTTNTSLTPTPSETLPAAQSGADTSVQPGSSTETSTPGSSLGAERGFPTAYLVAGICVAVLVGLAVVFLLVHRARSARGQRPAPADPTDQSAVEKDFQKELELVLRAWGFEVQKTLPPLPAVGEGSQSAELWDVLMESAQEAEAGGGLSVDEPEDAD